MYVKVPTHRLVDLSIEMYTACYFLKLSNLHTCLYVQCKLLYSILHSAIEVGCSFGEGKKHGCKGAVIN